MAPTGAPPAPDSQAIEKKRDIGMAIAELLQDAAVNTELFSDNANGTTMGTEKMFFLCWLALTKQERAARRLPLDQVGFGRMFGVKNPSTLSRWKADENFSREHAKLMKRRMQYKWMPAALDLLGRAAADASVDVNVPAVALGAKIVGLAEPETQVQVNQNIQMLDLVKRSIADENIVLPTWQTGEVVDVEPEPPPEEPELLPEGNPG